MEAEVLKIAGKRIPKYRKWKRKELKQLRALVGEGKKNREIAEIMGIPAQRVSNAKCQHIKRIRRAVPPPARQEASRQPQVAFGRMASGSRSGIIDRYADLSREIVSV